MMIRKWLRKILPKSHTLKKDKQISWIGAALHHPNIWHLNRYSVSKGVAIGLLTAFIPLPIQMLAAVLLAIFFKGNLPIAVALTWITNPVTFVPINYFIYKVGQLVTYDSAVYVVTYDFEIQGKTLTEIVSYFFKWVQGLSKSFLVGLIIVACSSSFLGYWLIRLVWRIGTVLQWRKRQLRGDKQP
jgi:uncharacterized protein